MPPIVAPFLRAAAELVMKRRRANLGFSRRFVHAGGYKWSYLDTAINPTAFPSLRSKQAAATRHQPTVVLVHGFSSDKDTWLPIAKYLVSAGFRVIIPDLRGHGATTPVCPTHNYGVEAQVGNLLTFLSALPATQATPDTLLSHPMTPSVHLVGYSMGGLIAGLFASTFPHLVRTLTLLCPAGISMPNPSPVLSLFDTAGLRLMEASTVDEMQLLLRYTQAATDVKATSRLVARAYAKIQAARKDVVTKIFADMEPERTTLEDRLDLITADTLVVWGDEDQILDVSCAAQMQKKGLRTIVVPRCGHDITQMRPQLCAHHITALINRDVKRRDKDADASHAMTMSSSAAYDDDCFSTMESTVSLKM